MFSRRKSETPLTVLNELYNEVANSSLSNLSLEQGGRMKEALQGWQQLQMSFGDKFSRVKAELDHEHLTDEESFILDEIMVLQSQAEEHMEKLEAIVDRQLREETAVAMRQAMRESEKDSRAQQPPPTARTRSQVILTMRGHSGNGIKRSLRNNSKSFTSSTTPASTKQAKQAANLIWSPSSSLTSGKSYSSSAPQDPFENFDTDFSTNKTSDDSNVDDLNDQFKLLSSSQKHYKSPSDRARAALQKSAAVKVPPPATVSRVRSPQHHHSSKSATRSRTVSPAERQSSPPQKELILSEATTEDADGFDSLDDKQRDQEKLIASLKGVDPVAARQILNEIIVNGDEVHWEDIAGLEAAKNSLKEAVVYPFLRPDLFRGLREPARGMLLFGPPGTGKTMLARAVATESQSTFFSISASSLTSKYLGESEKLVRALFQLAKKMAPSIIFVDEIDSLLGTRNNEGENEASRRIKNEFLVQWSDLTKAAAGNDNGEDVERVLVLAATNLPWSIDEAARRRFVRRQYIPLPEATTRRAQFDKLLSHQHHTMTEDDLNELVRITDGFSGSDITALAKDAAMGPLRELGDQLLFTEKADIRPVALKDFVKSLESIRPSVSKENLQDFEQWAKVYGSSGA